MFGKKNEEPVVVETVDAGTTIIAEGTEFKGDFTTNKPIHIYGKLDGNVASSSKVLVAKSGVMCGNGIMQTLEVEGTVDGELTCLEVAKITETGRVSGSLTTARLQTEEGSTFDGQLSMIKKQAKAETETEVKPE